MAQGTLTLAPEATPRPVTARRAGSRRAVRPRAVWVQAFFALLAWVVLLLGAITARNLASGLPRLGLITTNSGRVVLLDPNSPAARAGIRLGDMVAAVDGEEVRGHGFPSIGVALSPPRGLTTVAVGTPGRRVLRAIQLAPPSPVETAGGWAALAAALALWVSGLLTGLPRRRDPANRLYALAAFALSLAVCALVARDGPLSWPWLVLTPALLVGLGALLGGTILLAGPRRRPLLPRALLGAIALATALVAAGALFAASIPLPGAVDGAIAGLVSLLALAAIAAPPLLHARTHAEPPRRRLRVALLAGLLGLLPPLAWPGLTALAALLNTSAAPFPDDHVSPLWSMLGLVPMAALYGALGRTGARPYTSYPYTSDAGGLDARRLDLYARVGLSYVVAIALGAGLLAASWPVVPPQVFVALAAAVLILFPFVQRLAERLIDQSALRPRPDYDSALRLLESLAATATADDLAREVVTRLPAILQVRGAAVLLRAAGDPPGHYRAMTRDTYTRGAPTDALVRLDDDLDPDDADERSGARGGLPPGHGLAAVAGLGDMALWTPLRWSGARRGLLALGPRVSGDSFDHDDREGVASVAGVLTLAFQTLELVEHLRERTDTLVSLTHRLSHAHEQERGRLSRELHDVVAQELIALTRQLRRHGDGRTPSPEIWADMLAAAQDALAHTRRICNGLRPAILDLGLVPALRDLVNEADERAGATEVSLTVDGPEQRFPGDREFALFRVAQEGLSNALAHAGARQVRIEVLFDGVARVRVRDDGRGFVVPARFEDLPGDHLGLIGMRERLAEFGGALSVASTPSRGTVLEASVPL